MSKIYNKRNWYSGYPYYISSPKTDGTYIYVRGTGKLFKLLIADFETVTSVDTNVSFAYYSNNYLFGTIDDYVKKFATSDLSEVASYQKTGCTLSIIGIDNSYIYVRYYYSISGLYYYGIEKIQQSDLAVVDSYDATPSYKIYYFGCVDSSFAYLQKQGTNPDDFSILKIDTSDMTLVGSYDYSANNRVLSMVSTGTYLFAISDDKLRKILITDMTENSNIDIVSGKIAYYDGTSIWTLTYDYSPTLNTVQKRKVSDMNQETTQVDDNGSDFPIGMTYLNNQYFITYQFYKVSELDFQKKKYIMGYF
jgi:hypothetical protein